MSTQFSATIFSYTNRNRIEKHVQLNEYIVNCHTLAIGVQHLQLGPLSKIDLSPHVETQYPINISCKFVL